MSVKEGYIIEINGVAITIASNDCNITIHSKEGSLSASALTIIDILKSQMIDCVIYAVNETKQEMIERFDRQIAESDKLNPLLNNPLLNQKVTE